MLRKMPRVEPRREHDEAADTQAHEDFEDAARWPPGARHRRAAGPTMSSRSIWYRGDPEDAGATVNDQQAHRCCHIWKVPVTKK